jgi:orotidine-5'-phosphate decarboxylase
MKSGKEYIIFPLDVESLPAARRYVELLAHDVGLFKVGLELFVEAGPAVIETILAAGPARVFLDLKLHDIPSTVRRAMARIADLGVTFATVHCGENGRMLEAAVAGSGGRVGVLGVTVLTSVAGTDLLSAGFRPDLADDLARLVVQRAQMAQAAGCVGAVCSALEAAVLKRQLGDDFITVTPGIRPPWTGGAGEDQKRIATPQEAVLNGSDYLVIGRPIRDAEDPRAAARRIASDIDGLHSDGGCQRLT